ncbi:MULTISPECIES: lysophospholipid acyltransferase family protein [Dietzia]|uniref:Lysophospholipid acyltransferase family protein n=1 Tax=Dietzia cercidiphylli TaxID=498199 RepID=A0ABN2IMH3_9ACTN|nr:MULTISPECIES: lysophospholipid acyltransferase family protein [Dietzia]MBB1034728.1 1-acyl-sn-glycerol-3-phosphate acyltransferase [Dietzia sp. CQ4]MBB1038060.1 1-acyl-sn-glycerol-3-phosphate acyltransferase [Dietzia natronolimnaea]MBB1049038.1 1-acyl-sn-glycerol-3-phosphate acyltransferase [Dietzia cercidiphylli]MBB1056853.1 1-acyl-sn-glycerol-3-phosphate acyltransferase [Dietzia sp. B19]MCT1516775.1 1-acyl-sn-glycerol-3-phosphate acyltransferase [Dietzia cercidiphylli]
MLYWLFKYVIIGPFLRLTSRPVITGRENFPTSGAAVLVGNHESVADWLFTPLLLPRRVTFLAKSDYFTGTGIRGMLSRWFFAGTGQYPIDRTDADAAQAALNAGLEVLSSGQILCVYPEGTRSPDGRLYRGKTGPARLALRAGVPIVPVGVIGTGEYIRKVNRPHRRTRVRVMIGEPLDLTPWAGREGDRVAEREITDEFMRRIQALTGQEYVHDTYGAEMKKRYEAVRKSGRNLLDQPVEGQR